MKLVWLRIAAALPIACAAAGVPAGHAKTEDAPTLADGRWGGEHVVVEVSRAGAKIQFDCAHGGIAGAISLERDGRFDAGGDYVAEHGGPIRVGESETHRSVRYTGRVQGRTMSLTVELGGDHGSLGPFALGLGNEGRIVRCR
jgi:hypothetical protein